MAEQTKAELIADIKGEIDFFENWDHDGSHSAEGERLEGLERARNELSMLI
tara:strand:- start:241 stop:393 length:153 start_codon:yes stop_codon:yes gene_type:complete